MTNFTRVFQPIPSWLNWPLYSLQFTLVLIINVQYKLTKKGHARNYIAKANLGGPCLNSRITNYKITKKVHYAYDLHFNKKKNIETEIK